MGGRGGGSGYSPNKMMNEWSLPIVMLQAAVCNIVEKLREQGLWVPAVTMTGGFSSEDQVFKSLAYGGNTVTAVGLCRAAMTAAMMGKKNRETGGAGQCTEAPADVWQYHRGAVR